MIIVYPSISHNSVTDSQTKRIIFIFYPNIHKSASSANRALFAHFLNFAFGSIFKNCLLVHQPQTPLNTIYNVGYAPYLGALSKIKSSSFLTFPVGSFAAVYCVAILSKRMFRGLGVTPSSFCKMLRQENLQK